MATTNERLLQWLHDSQAIEQQTGEMLKALARHIENYPEVKAEAKRLLKETSEQAAVVQDAVEQRGGDASILNEGQPGATERALSGAFVGTESAKQSMTEISSYNVLIAAAEAVGDSETRAVCKAILRREEAMAEWLKNYLASVTAEYLTRPGPPA